MQQWRGELGPIGEVVSGLDDVARRVFTQADQVNQLVRASEADPDLGFMGALLHNSGRVTDRSQSCLNAIECALTQACPGLTYDSVPHI